MHPKVAKQLIAAMWRIQETS